MWLLPAAWLLKFGWVMYQIFTACQDCILRFFSFYLLRKISEGYETKRSSMTCALDMAAVANCF